MTPTSEICPHCGAPLAITRFAAIVVCSFCDATIRIDPAAVPARKFRDAFAEWNAAPAGENGRNVSIGGTHWLKERLLASGEISDVYLARRARWPSELAVVKVLRDREDAPLFEHEWSVLHALRKSSATDSIDWERRAPVPVAKGDGTCAYRWAGGFTHTFEMVREVRGEGIPPVAAIWVWRRILEALTVMQRAGFVHGAILPNHLLVQNGEHGVRLVGFSCADVAGAPLRAVCADFEEFYPAPVIASRKLTPAADVAMSARCVSYLVGSRTDVPDALADLLRTVSEDGAEPWPLHKQVGELGRKLFGPPAYHPIALN